MSVTLTATAAQLGDNSLFKFTSREIELAKVLVIHAIGACSTHIAHIHEGREKAIKMVSRIE